MNSQRPLNFIGLIAIFSLLASVSPARAQDGLTVGAKVLGNVTKFKATNRGYGYGVGGYAFMPILGRLSGRGEILYVSYAGTLPDSSRQFDGGNIINSAKYENRNVRFHSVEIPLMAQYDLPILEKLNPRVAIGWAYTWNFAAYYVSDKTLKVGSDGSSREYLFKNSMENISSSFSKYNSSILGSFSIGFSKISVDVRYQQGLNNLSTVNVQSGQYYGDYKSRTLTLSIGYQIM